MPCKILQNICSIFLQNLPDQSDARQVNHTAEAEGRDAGKRTARQAGRTHAGACQGLKNQRTQNRRTTDHTKPAGLQNPDITLQNRPAVHGPRMPARIWMLQKLNCYIFFNRSHPFTPFLPAPSNPLNFGKDLDAAPECRRQ